MEIVFVKPANDNFFGRGESNKPPRKPYQGPLFKRPDGSRDPLAEERVNLENGIFQSWGC